MSQQYFRTTGNTQVKLAQPYGRIMTIFTPLITLTFVIWVVSFQLFHFTFAQAITISRKPEAVFSNALLPLIAQSHIKHAANPQQRLLLSIGLRPSQPQSLPSSVANQQAVSIAPRHPEGKSTTLLSQIAVDEKLYMHIQQYLQHAGFTITHTYNHHLLIEFSGTVKQVEQFFHTRINIYTAPDNTIYYANSQAPQVPGWLLPHLQSINGLNNASHWYHAPWHLHEAQEQALRKSNACPNPDSTGGAILPAQLSGIYNLDGLYQEHYQGEGQTLAIFELGRTETTDINAYTACFEHSHTAVQIINTGTLPDNAEENGAQMDAELILSAAPKLSVLEVYETTNDDVGYLSQWAQILEDAPPIVMTSWGQCESAVMPQVVQQENIFFQYAAQQGQTLLAATGDHGSPACSDNPAGTSTAVEDPGTQPYITSIGGTTLQFNKGMYTGETPWNNSDDHTQIGESNGSVRGGISRYWAIPSWQNMVGVPDPKYSASGICSQNIGKSHAYCREIPDVSLNADPHHGYWIYCTTVSLCDSMKPWAIAGGTAIATPLWAAFVALTNEMLQKQGGRNVGCLNPLLYSIANDPIQYAHSFHDIVTINADGQSAQPQAYPATVGYDMATGLGSFNALDLATALTKSIN